jgi:hypothetical protein
MATFDFIGQRNFRLSLESDYQEMLKALESQSWKSVQVMAGSIVETLLVDYLVSTTFPGRSSNDPLKMNLVEIVSICKSEGVISERTADLCSVVRSYRNLIHAGKAERMGEQPPDEDSAGVAAKLVHIIAKEVGTSRTAKLGYTAEQVVAKVCKDDNSLSILKHLLEETNEEQKLTLLMESIPRKHLAMCEGDEPGIARRLGRAFRTAFKMAEVETQTTVARDFVKKIKEADTEYVDWYRTAFFFSGFVQRFTPAERLIVVDYLLGTLKVTDPECFEVFLNVGSLLTPAEADRWIDVGATAAIRHHEDEDFLRRLYDSIGVAHSSTTAAFDQAVINRLQSHWMRTYDSGSKHAALTSLLAHIEIPF